MDRADAAATAETSPPGEIRPSRAQVPEVPGADDGRIGFGAFAVRYQPESFSGEDTTWPGWSRVFSHLGWTVPTWTSTRSHPSSGSPTWTTVTELDLKLEDWASAELKSAAADFCHALILFCTGKALNVVLTKGCRNQGLAIVCQQVRARSMGEHLLLKATKCDSWSNFVREVESIEHGQENHQCADSDGH